MRGDTPLKAAVVGCGNVFPMHAYPVANMEGVELVAICDNKLDVVNWRNKEFNVKAYTDFDEMLATEQLDILHICTPHYLHAPMAIKAFEKGLHVLTEKPMSITLDDAKAMIGAADKAGKTLGVIFQNHYNPASQLVKRALDSGRLGGIKGVKCSVTWDRSDEYYSRSDWKGTWDKEGGGVVIDQAIHTLDLCRWLIDSPVVSVSAHTSNRNHHFIEVEDSAEGVINFQNGVALAFFTINYHSYDAPIRIELHCENGIATILGDQAKIEYIDGSEESAGPDPRKSFDYGNVKSYWGVSHVTQIDNFYDCIRTGKTPDICGREALKTQEMVCAIYESGRSGARVKIR